MKRLFSENGLKRVFIGALSASIMFGSFSSVIAENTAELTETESKVQTEVTTTIGNIEGVKSSASDLFTGANSASVDVNENSEISLKSDVSEAALFSTTDAGKAVLKATDKYSISFDVKLPDSYSKTSQIWLWGNDQAATGEKNSRISILRIAQNKLLFSKGGDPTSSDINYAVEPNTWVNVKFLMYTKKDSNDINRFEWYVNDELVGVGTASANNCSPSRILHRAYLANADNTLSFRNIKFEQVKNEDRYLSEVVEKSTLLDEVNVNGSKNSILLPGNFDVSSDDMMSFKSGALATVSAGTLANDSGYIYKKYSLGYDIYIDPNQADSSNNNIGKVMFLDGKVFPDKTYDGMFGVINFFRKEFNVAATGVNNETNGGMILDEGIHRVEFVIEPSTGVFDYYVDGRSVLELVRKNNPNIEFKVDSTVDKNYRCSVYPIISTIYSGAYSKFKFNNFRLSAVGYVPKSSETEFIVSADKDENGIKLSFNKELVRNNALINEIILKDSNGRIITPDSIEQSADNRTILLRLDAPSAEFYSIQLPERFFSNDGFVISNTTVTTPHFEITQAGFTSNDNTVSFVTNYNNTLNKPENILAVIAAYDKTTGVLKAVDTKQYTVNANESFVPVEYPTLVNDSNTVIKGFIWNASTIAPKYVITPAQ